MMIKMDNQTLVTMTQDPALVVTMSLVTLVSGQVCQPWSQLHKVTTDIDIGALYTTVQPQYTMLLEASLQLI